MSEYEVLAIKVKAGRSNKNETQIVFAENCDISTKTGSVKSYAQIYFGVW